MCITTIATLLNEYNCSNNPYFFEIRRWDLRHSSTKIWYFLPSSWTSRWHSQQNAISKVKVILGHRKTQYQKLLQTFAGIIFSILKNYRTNIYYHHGVFAEISVNPIVSVRTPALYVRKFNYLLTKFLCIHKNVVLDKYSSWNI